jgi:hypothetical protein
LTVHADGVREALLACVSTHVKKVSCLRLAPFEVDEVESTSCVHDGLGLNAAVGGAEEFYAA